VLEVVITEEEQRYFEFAEKAWEIAKGNDELELKLKRADKAWNRGEKKKAFRLVKEILEAGH
jgi:hypothetical protein